MERLSAKKCDPHYVNGGATRCSNLEKSGAGQYLTCNFQPVLDKQVCALKSFKHVPRLFFLALGRASSLARCKVQNMLC